MGAQRADILSWPIYGNNCNFFLCDAIEVLRILANVGIRDCMSLRAPHLLLPPFVVTMQSRLCHPWWQQQDQAFRCVKRNLGWALRLRKIIYLQRKYFSVSVSTLILSLCVSELDIWPLRRMQDIGPPTALCLMRGHSEPHHKDICIRTINSVSLLVSFLPSEYNPGSPHILIHCIIVATNKIYANNTYLAPHIFSN